MKYIKLNKIYKINKSSILIKFNIDSQQYEIYINSSNISKMKKCLKRLINLLK